jgi:hypothetical protein
MSSKLTIPAELVRTLRIGLHSELGQAASEIVHITDQRGREEHPDWYQEPLARLDGARALLDVVGWGETRLSAGIEIELTEHHTTLFAALDSQVLIHQDMVEEADQVDAERAEQGKPAKGTATIARAAALNRLLASAETQAVTLGLDRRWPGGGALNGDS